ncbi:MAG: tetratricopeptide repeat protein [Flavobacteriales bacterium]|nr:tetratricopeptide repeat protein [Flavobacteriales bacterium]
MRNFFLLFFLALNLVGFAQDTDEELAAQYFNNEEYDKAEILYQRLHKKNSESVYIYQNYLNCLLKLNNLSEAEKMVSRQVKKYPDKPLYVVDLGYLFKETGKTKEADELYENAISKAVSSLKRDASTVEVEQLAGALVKRDEYDFAKKALLEGRKASGYSILFSQNLMDIYKAKGQSEALVNECLDVLAEAPSDLERVKSNLVFLVDRDIKMDYLQEKAALYIQKHPQNTSFDDLLMWIFVQQKKFNSALRQAAAMDKRNKTDGRTLIELAETCLSNDEFEVAEKCFDKVLEFGNDGYYYLVAKAGKLETAYRRITTSQNFSEQDVNNLVGQYENMIATYGKDQHTAPSIKELSDIYIFYKHDAGKGIELLEGLLTIPYLPRNDLGEYKLALGDAYLIKGDIWEATLLYGQVDKEFKEDALGQEAKFRNARLSYFKGDFDWAKEQLDVLKTATSQLISNNAIELTLLIKDNTGLDSNTDAMKAFATSQLLLFQNKLDESLSILNKLPLAYPNHALEDEIYLAKAQIFFKQGLYEKAEEYYQNIINYFADDILADNALFALAKLYEHQLNNPEKAIEMYEKIIFNYPGSLFVVDARKRYNKLKSNIAPQ